MKKFILIITLLISSMFLTAQDYPRIEIDSLGRKVVVMTIEQAQKIDNNFEIVELLKRQGSECDSLNVAYLKVIDNYKKQVALLELDVNNLKLQISDKDIQISNLQERLSNSETSNKLCDEQKAKYDESVACLKKEIRKQKIQKIIGFGVGVVGVVGGFLLYLGVLI